MTVRKGEERKARQIRKTDKKDIQRKTYKRDLE